jgi:hypothetical protein
MHPPDAFSELGVIVIASQSSFQHFPVFHR